MKKYLLAALGLLLGASVAFASGVFTNGMTVATPPLSGYEQLGVDTELPAGQTPQSEAVTINQLLVGSQVANSNTSTITASAGLVSGAAKLNVLLTGAITATQTLTLPSATTIVNSLKAAFPNLAANYSYVVKFINTGGTAGGFWNLSAGSGDTITGNTNVPPGGSRQYLVTVTSVSSPAITFQDYGN